MKERPILFKGEMVRAILEGRKRMTRRAVKPQPWVVRDGSQIYPKTNQVFRDARHEIICPYGNPGDRLWVRETFRLTEDPATCLPGSLEIDYRADGVERIKDRIGKSEWRPSIFMPRWASRITLEVVSVRVERVQDITPQDCWAEGIDPKTTHIGARYSFGQLWNSINESRGFGWDVNPWVWVVEFKRVID